MLYVGLSHIPNCLLVCNATTEKRFEECTREVPYHESSDGGPLQLR